MSSEVEVAEVAPPLTPSVATDDSPRPAEVEKIPPAAQGSGDLLTKAQQHMPGQMQDYRGAERIRMRLPAVLFSEISGIKEKSHGHSVDISSSGCSFVTLRNLRTPQPGSVFIMAKRANKANPAVIIEAQCRLIDSVFSSQQGGFRISISFTKLLGDGAQVLKELLKDKHPISRD
jgi:hypothetical protein